MEIKGQIYGSVLPLHLYIGSGDQLGLSGLAASSLTHQAILLTQDWQMVATIKLTNASISSHRELSFCRFLACPCCWTLRFFLYYDGLAELPNTDLLVYTHGSKRAEAEDCIPNDPIKPHLPEPAPDHCCPGPVCVVSVSTVSFAIDVIAGEMDRYYGCWASALGQALQASGDFEELSPLCFAVRTAITSLLQQHKD